MKWHLIWKNMTTQAMLIIPIIARCNSTEIFSSCFKVSPGTSPVCVVSSVWQKSIRCCRPSCLHCMVTSTKVVKSIYYWLCFRYEKPQSAFVFFDYIINLYRWQLECSGCTIRDNNRIHLTASSKYTSISHDDNLYPTWSRSVVSENRFVE